MQYDEDMDKLAAEYLEEGRQAFSDNKLEQALLLVQNALHMFRRVGNMRDYAIAMNLMGVIYAATGNEAMSIDYYLEGLEYALEHKLNSIISVFYNNIGSRYQELNNHEKAIFYFKKALMELENPECRKEERYETWCLVTYMNLLVSYFALQENELAEKYLDLAESFFRKDVITTHKYTFLITKCWLYWNIGRSDFVYQKLKELMESGEKDVNTSDYVQDMRNLCGLLKEMGEFDKWKVIIESFEQNVKDQEAVYFQLIQAEMWMEYYKTTGDRERYIEQCVKHAELYKKQKEVTDKERIAAIDIKIKLREKEAERKYAELKSSTDPLTGLGNRYLLEIDAVDIIDKAIRNRQKMAVGVLDVDCFKHYNDTYGHIQGDKCLKLVANVIQRSIGELAKAYRFGGDEFVLLFTSGNQKDVINVAEAIKAELRRTWESRADLKKLIEITVSQGYAYFLPTEGESGECLIEHADKALYQVKQNGRNGFKMIVEG